MQQNNTIFKINGVVQHYAWGGVDYIPQLLSINNPENKPFAEYWLGAHPSAPSIITSLAKPTSLFDFIQQNPATILGNNVYNAFKELPYLFKVLDVKEMLSIQVHPSKSEAVKGFEAEEAAGIDIKAVNRNYKDKNHKPEVMVALSDFWLLHGFKNEATLERTLEGVPELNIFLPIFKNEGYKSLYLYIMEMEQSLVNTILMPLVKREFGRKKQRIE